MKKDSKIAKAAVLAVLLAACGAWAQGAAAAPAALTQRPAARLAVPAGNLLLDAARAGERLVAVGDRGMVLLSDDGGATYRQATTVPTRATLTAVSFVDARNGWAVGHWGVILHTADGGETWTLQREDTASDQPLFSVWFKDARTGYAVGLWSLMLRTVDGGRTWSTAQVPPPDGSGQADRNLFKLFADERGNVFIAAERGLVYKSADGGATWRPIETGSKGTFWAGTASRSGVLLLGGLQGRVYRSLDAGETWKEVATGAKSSITAMRQFPDGGIVAVGLDGLVMRSDDDGASFRVSLRDDQRALTAVAVDGAARPALFSMQGVVIDAARRP
ncbi:MAG: glycosyl hydrolase [Burkholderiaceae bacterium]|nr:glycosyl hydrolase [Burkholderiaceae bacterium]